MPASPTRPLRILAVALLVCATVTASRGNSQPTFTQSSGQCGQSNPDGPCTGSPPECYNQNGRCVGTEPLCRFDWLAGGPCSSGVCQADFTCRPNGGGGTPAGDCATTPCPANQRCVANRCVDNNPTVVNPNRGGCAGNPGRR